MLDLWSLLFLSFPRVSLRRHPHIQIRQPANNCNRLLLLQEGLRLVVDGGGRGAELIYKVNPNYSTFR